MPRGRPKNEGEGEKLTFNVPAGLFAYLKALAAKEIVGKQHGEVARYLLTERAVQLEKEGFLGVKFPDSSDTGGADA